jgi:hypothetical protein
VYAGGLAGSRGNGDITHSAVLGAKITTNGDTGPDRGRIYGWSSGGSSSKNYAIDTMQFLGTASPYTPSSSHSSKDGEDTELDDFRNANFWQKTGGLSFNNTGSGGFEGLTREWDTFKANLYGYPHLLDEEGQPLGTQTSINQ